MATLNITVPDAVVSRIRDAVGGIRGLKDGNGDPRTATTAEVEQETRNYYKTLVVDWETQAQKNSISVPDTGLDA